MVSFITSPFCIFPFALGLYNFDWDIARFAFLVCRFRIIPQFSAAYAVYVFLLSTRRSGGGSQRGRSRFCRVLLVPYPEKGHNEGAPSLGQIVPATGRLPWTMMPDAPASMLKCESASALRSSRRASHHHPCRVSAAFAKAGLTDRLARFRRAWKIVLPASA